MTKFPAEETVGKFTKVGGAVALLDDAGPPILTGDVNEGEIFDKLVCSFCLDTPPNIPDISEVIVDSSIFPLPGTTGSPRTL